MTTAAHSEAVPAPVGVDGADIAPSEAGAPSEPTEAAVLLEVRVEPAGPSSERAIALACAGSALARDPDAPHGRPAAAGEIAGGEAVLAELVRAAALALDETDLHLTVRRR